MVQGFKPVKPTYLPATGVSSDDIQEHRGFEVFRDQQWLYKVQPLAGGSAPNGLLGRFTSPDIAKRAIDNYATTVKENNSNDK